jgi:hypothetical protein
MLRFNNYDPWFQRCFQSGNLRRERRLLVAIMKVVLQPVCNVLLYNEVTLNQAVQNMSAFRVFSWKGFVGKAQGLNQFS